MSKAARRLGRGLDSLVSDLLTDPGRIEPDRAAGHPTQPSETDPRLGIHDITMLPIDELSPNPLQPRSQVDDDSMSSLAKSISSSGILQPIAVRQKEDGYEIIAGERRWRAARSAGMDRVPVFVHSATDEQMIEFALIENIQREDLNPIDRAMGYQQFCKRFDLKADDLANRLAEDRTTVVNYLRLLDLPECVRDEVARGRISMGHARCLAGVASEDRQAELAAKVLEDHLSVRALEAIVRQDKVQLAGGGKQPAKRPVDRSPHVRLMERRFEEALKTKVVIREGKQKGSGRIIIDYYTLDDFDRIASLLDLETSEPID